MKHDALSGRERIARIIHPVGFEENSMERVDVVAAYRAEALRKADAILADSPILNNVGRFWLELREPNYVPDLKGPFKIARLATTLREFMSARPSAFITVVTLDATGPAFEDGPSALMMADGRSRMTGLRHIETSKAAHAQCSDGFSSGLEAAALWHLSEAARAKTIRADIDRYSDDPEERAAWRSYKDMEDRHLSYARAIRRLGREEKS